MRMPAMAGRIAWQFVTACFISTQMVLRIAMAIRNGLKIYAENGHITGSTFGELPHGNTPIGHGRDELPWQFVMADSVRRSPEFS